MTTGENFSNARERASAHTHANMHTCTRTHKHIHIVFMYIHIIYPSLQRIKISQKSVLWVFCSLKSVAGRLVRIDTVFYILNSLAGRLVSQESRDGDLSGIPKSW